MDLVDHINAIAKDFSTAREEEFSGHALAKRIRKDWPDSVRQLLKESGRTTEYMCSASPGQGRWSHAPWLALLHPDITTTAQAGFYPVYLFEPGFKSVCLVLGQGTYKLCNALGRAAAYAEIEKRAKILRKPQENWRKKGFIQGPFSTLKAVTVSDPNEAADDEWSASVAFGKRYAISALPDNDSMAKDLMAMLDLYEVMATSPRLQFTSLDNEIESLKDAGELPDNVGGIDGVKKIIKHKQIEQRQRNSKLVREVKKTRLAVCEACKFSFGQMYGSHLKEFIEAHHKVPLATLPSHGAKLTSDDFLLLCSNCHRAIHRAGCPDLSEFRASLKGEWAMGRQPSDGPNDGEAS